MADHARRVLLEYAIEPFGVRVGIEAGLAVTGPVGGGSRMEYGATGDVVNTAARLQSKHASGRWSSGRRRERRCTSCSAGRILTAVELRGKGEVLDVAEAAGTRGDAPRARRLPGRGAPLVGRDRELATALEELDRLAGGGGVAVVIEGEAGVGKTRLLETLRERSRAGAAWLDATCTSLGSSTPYAPIAQLLASWGRSLGGGGRAEDLVPAGRDAARAALAVLAGEPTPPQRERFAALSPAGRQLATEEAIATFVRSAARERSLVISVEDLHWSDAARSGRWSGWSRCRRPSRSRSCSRARRDRSGPAAAIDRFAHGDHFVPIKLDALPSGADRDLVVSLDGEGALPPALFARVLDVGAGNPFFLGELSAR